MQQVAGAAEDFNTSAPVTAGQFSNLALPTSLSNNTTAKPNKAQVDKRAYADAIAEQRLQSYMQSHIQNSALNTSSGVMPYARISHKEGK